MNLKIDDYKTTRFNSVSFRNRVSFRLHHTIVIDF